MKYNHKKFIIPCSLGLLGVLTTAAFLISQNQNAKPQVNKYIAIKINGKNVYPFQLLFPKGTSIKNIKIKFGITASNLVMKKKNMKDDMQIYENSTFKISN